MKFFQLLTMPLLAALLVLSSCSGNETTTTEDTSTTTTTTDTMNTGTTATTGTATPTFDTTRMHMMLAIHRVKNFNTWKASYDAHDSMRLANNMRSYMIGRSIPDSDRVIVAVTADSISKARAFSRDARLKKAMQEGGVTGTPEFRFITLRNRNTAAPDANFRAISSFTVKDFEAWRTGFEQGRQERMDNGVVDRAYGHDPDNEKKVTVIVSITDTARANAYWNSDQLKQRRAAGGVTDQPKRIMYQVVQRYQ
jgi:hypothetical protein